MLVTNLELVTGIPLRHVTLTAPAADVQLTGFRGSLFVGDFQTNFTECRFHGGPSTHMKTMILFGLPC